MNRILIVDDDKALCQGIMLALRDEGNELIPCADCQSARAAIAQGSLTLAILDVALPDGTGLQLLQEIKQTLSIPVILLTARDLETDIVLGLESGADDYITKPFSLAVLRARVRTQLRRKENTGQPYRQDDFDFDFDKMEFYSHHIPIVLSKTEQKLLRILVENAGITLSRAALLERVWSEGYVDENALSVTMKRLRDKLEPEPSKPKYMKTIYGIGYTWVRGKD